MLLCIFLILGMWRGVIGNDYLCKTHPEHACERNSYYGFPKTEEDINRMCPILQCLKDYSSKCGHDVDLRDDRLMGLKNIVEDLCREGSALHAGVVQNIGCFNEVAEKDYESCSKHIEPMVRKMANYIIVAERDDEDSHDQELWESYRCLVESLKYVCFISKVSDRCGTDAKGFLIELLTSANVTSRVCSATSEGKLAELFSVVELESDEVSTLNILFGKE